MRRGIMKSFRSLVVLSAGLAILAAALAAGAQEEPQLTVEQQKEFLRTAKLVSSRVTGEGVTAPRQCTLSDGTITHDALFQSVDDRRSSMEVMGRIELNFVDSYLYNLAAYELATMLGLERMMPASVERELFGERGCLSWWLPAQFDELTRLARKIVPPDPTAWNAQMADMAVFSQLVRDTDRNAVNVLIGPNWEIYMIDFTRAFRLEKSLDNPKALVRCRRELLDRLRRLDPAEVTARTKGFLRPPEVKAVMARRDKIVAHFAALAAAKGEAAVLF
jgi:hypothetical protein